METTASDTVIRCAVSGTERKTRLNKDGTPALPRGWKSRNGDPISPQGLQSHFVQRAITVPIDTAIDGNWADLCSSLRQLWDMSAQVANLTATDLLRQEEAPTWNADKERFELGQFPRADYRRARDRFPGYPTGSLVALQNNIAGTYGKQRHDVLIKCGRSLPSFNAPMALPIKNGTYRLAWDEDNQAVMFACRLLDQRWVLRLKAGANFRRQSAALRKVIEGAAIPCEAAIVPKRVPSNRGGGISYRRPGGGQKVRFQPVVKIVLWLAKEQKLANTRTETLVVRTRPSSLLVARLKHRKRNGWWAHQDHLLRSWMAAHRQRLDRLSDDAKANVRQRDGLGQHRNALVRKHRQRVDTALHQISAELADFAERMNVGEVYYDDSVQEFVPRFPWYDLRQRIAMKLDEKGIDFVTPEIRAQRKSQSEFMASIEAIERTLTDMLERTDTDDHDGDAATD